MPSTSSTRTALARTHDRRARRAIALLPLLIAAAPVLAAEPSNPPIAVKAQTIAVPGFADFLAVDGDGVWATNKGRVERWSRAGKRASVVMNGPCGAMAVAARSLWVADCKDASVVRIDLATARIVARIPTGIANPKGETNVVAGAGSIWVPSDDAGAIARIDPATNSIVSTIAVDPGTHYLAFGFGSLWAVSSAGRSLQQIDPKAGTVVRRITLGTQPGFLTAGEGAVWVQEQGDGTVARIDPRSGEITGRVKVGANLLYGDIDTGGGAVWLRTTADQTMVVIDPASLAIVARLGKAEGSGALRHAGNGVWTSAHDVHTLSWWRVSPR